MTIINSCTLIKDDVSCHICLEFYENSYVIMVTESDNRSTETRYFRDEKTARDIFFAIKNNKNKNGWIENKICS